MAGGGVGVGSGAGEADPEVPRLATWYRLERSTADTPLELASLWTGMTLIS
jgi:hypothetical protein